MRDVETLLSQIILISDKLFLPRILFSLMKFRFENSLISIEWTYLELGYHYQMFGIDNTHFFCNFSYLNENASNCWFIDKFLMFVFYIFGFKSFLYDQKFDCWTFNFSFWWEKIQLQREKFPKKTMEVNKYKWTCAVSFVVR